MTEIEEAPGYGSPVRPIRYIVENDDEIGYVNRIIVGTPTRGSVRIEWHSAVRGLMVPPNWSMVTMPQQMSPYIPLRFQVADAQNLIVAKCLELDFEWLLLLEDDVVPPVDLFVKLNDYMREGQVPVVSGLYYLKSEPSEPIIYRGAGTGSFHDFELGEKVWADGVPTGCLLIHHAILRTMWDDSEEYNVGSQTVRMVFQSPAKSWMDPETGNVATASGTSDLDWCKRVIRESVFKRSGWDAFHDVKYPFLVDTGIQCWHITPDGQVFPPNRPIQRPSPIVPNDQFPTFPPKEEPESPPDLGVAVADDLQLADRPG